MKENASNEDTVSGNLLVKSGMIKKSSSGVYILLPLGLKVVKKIENIIREEMENIGCYELLMPSLLPEEVFIKSGRRDNFGKSMFALKDRNEKNYVLGPSHEEMFTIAASAKIKSYKDLPVNLFQLQTKYRDEPRPRFGLIRLREFIMKDAYSFDLDLDGLDVSYKNMYSAYRNIFDRLGLNYTVVKADTGVMGGFMSEEFQALTDIGEDLLVVCGNCEYSSNIEVAECVDKVIENPSEKLEKQLVHTPDAKSIMEVAQALNEEPGKFVKTMIYKGDEKYYACLVKGDRDVNELKLSRLLNVKNLELAEHEAVERITGAAVGFAGPIQLDIPIVMDNEIKYMKNFITGANKTDYHFRNVNLSDFKCQLISDIKNISENDVCPCCGHQIVFKKGIEVGNIFKYGSKYSESLGLYYSDTTGSQIPVSMGAYGIGVERCLAAVVEQNSDEKGIIWPMNIAPYKVCIVIANTSNEKQVQVGEDIYENLKENGIEVVLDDRNDRIGVKLNDMDLIGIPVRILVGNKLQNGTIELKYRNSTEVTELQYPYDINKLIQSLK
jgi:prolyl-tRNA synthetase